MIFKAFFGISKKKDGTSQAVEAQNPRADFRRSPRHRVMKKTAILVSQRPMKSVIVDVSREGARIAALFPRHAGEVVGLSIDVDGNVMTLPLRLAWDKRNDSGWEFGGSFVDLTPEETAHLNAFLVDVSYPGTTPLSKGVAGPALAPAPSTPSTPAVAPSAEHWVQLEDARDLMPKRHDFGEL